MDFCLHFAEFISKYIPSVLQNAGRRVEMFCCQSDSSVISCPRHLAVPLFFQTLEEAVCQT